MNTSSKQNQQRVTKVTEFKLFGIELYLSPIVVCQEFLYLQGFTSFKYFISEIYEYIGWYNNKRIKLRHGGMSLVQFRLSAA